MSTLRGAMLAPVRKLAVGCELDWSEDARVVEPETPKKLKLVSSTTTRRVLLSDSVPAIDKEEQRRESMIGTRAIQ